MSTTVDLSSLNVETASTNKRVVAEKIFQEHYGKSKRKDIIALFMEHANLTHNGASTYFQNFKKKYDALIAAKQAELAASEVHPDEVEEA